MNFRSSTDTLGGDALGRWASLSFIAAILDFLLDGMLGLIL